MSDTEKEAYEQKMEARLERWQAQIDELKARAKEADADTKAEIAKRLKELEKHSEGAREKLHELRASSGEAWKDVKFGAERSWETLEDALKAAWSRFT
jgi:septal ring factor EnvC (AmiA/AmiB activator)